MKNMNVQLFNELVNSAEGLEVNFKVGKECELNVKGNFMAMAKIVGIILEKEAIESRERSAQEINDCKQELNELLTSM